MASVLRRRGRNIHRIPGMKATEDGGRDGNNEATIQEMLRIAGATRARKKQEKSSSLEPRESMVFSAP